MVKSRVFYTDTYKAIERATLELINSQPDFMSKSTVTSPRAAGDAIQLILSHQFQNVLGNLCCEYSADFARRAMADLAFTDYDGFYYLVDVKTHRVGAGFSMPNLTSVERIARLYEDDKNFFVVLSIRYAVKETRVTVQEVHFVPIEFLSWKCLTIGALGWGQIQIADAAKALRINEKYSRKEWMLELCDIMFDFYPREIAKITDRIEYFRKVKQHWEKKPDN
ncbi:MAG: hypothetical protein HYY30_03600 [Chloroflexi bacterium]|nr:hypothetical protein [Chloroflexota bacterium]